MLCDDLDGWVGGVGSRELQEGGDIDIHIADSLCCTAETNTCCKVMTLQKIYIKVKLMPRKEAPSPLTLEEKQPSVDFLTQMSHPVSCHPKSF